MPEVRLERQDGAENGPKSRDAADDRHRIQIASPRALRWPVAARSTSLLISVPLSPRWWQALAGREAFRYCPGCIGLGYQSVLCQMDGLQRCPIHRCPLTDRCLTCTARTPTYAFTLRSFEPPMICTTCKRPYAQIWDVQEGAGGQWSAALAESAAHEGLGRWLRRLNDVELDWADRLDWLGDPRSQRLELKRYKRQACAAALASVVPAPMPLGGRLSLQQRSRYQLRIRE